MLAVDHPRLSVCHFASASPERRRNASRDDDHHPASLILVSRLSVIFNTSCRLAKRHRDALRGAKCLIADDAFVLALTWHKSRWSPERDICSCRHDACVSWIRIEEKSCREKATLELRARFAIQAKLD